MVTEDAGKRNFTEDEQGEDAEVSNETKGDYSSESSDSGSRAGDGVKAATIVDSGTCGIKLRWTLDEEGVLIISGNGAMYDMPGFGHEEDIKRAILNEGVTNIGAYSFQGCKNMTSIDIPNSVTTIGAGAFGQCWSLTSIDIPKGVTSIGDGAFLYCIGLASIDLPEQLTNIGKSAFESCNGINSITIPGGVNSMGGYAFSDCRNLTSVKILDGVTKVGPEAFYNCVGLTEVTLSSSLTSINRRAFGVCSSLTKIEIPNKVTFIGTEAFTSNDSMISITIPASVTSIESGAFYHCVSVKYIFYDGSEDQWKSLKNRPQKGIVHYFSTGHNWNENYTVDKESTCTTEGSESIHCAVCDAVKENSSKLIQKKPHEYGDWATTKEPTCTEDGSRSIVQDATRLKMKKVSLC